MFGTELYSFVFILGKEGICTYSGIPPIVGICRLKLTFKSCGNKFTRRKGSREFSLCSIKAKRFKIRNYSSSVSFETNYVIKVFALQFSIINS